MQRLVSKHQRRPHLTTHCKLPASFDKARRRRTRRRGAFQREVTQRPIKFAGLGKTDQFEPFVPELGGRILGRGDIVGWSKKLPKRRRDEARVLRKNPHRFLRLQRFFGAIQNDAKAGRWKIFIGSCRMITCRLSVDEKRSKRTEAIVLSMTNQERSRPDVLNARRRQRIARGSAAPSRSKDCPRFNQMAR